jgi:two-component system, LytTR family, response regulator
MIKIIIIEDDPDSLLHLKRHLTSEFPDIRFLGEANSIVSGINLINIVRPDLIFLDIELSDGIAFELLAKIGPAHFEIIFVTAHNEYILKALRFSAVDYLLKPVDSDELQHAVIKAVERIKAKEVNNRISNLLDNLRNKNTLTRIALPVKAGFDFVDIKEITHCEAIHNCTVVYHQSGTKYTCTRTMKEYCELLPGDIFFRIHHGYIVNVNFVKRYHKEGRGGYVEMIDGSAIEVASRRKDEFLLKFGYK